MTRRLFDKFVISPDQISLQFRIKGLWFATQIEMLAGLSIILLSIQVAMATPPQRSARRPSTEPIFRPLDAQALMNTVAPGVYLLAQSSQKKCELIVSLSQRAFRTWTLQKSTVTTVGRQFRWDVDASLSITSTSPCAAAVLEPGTLSAILDENSCQFEVRDLRRQRSESIPGWTSQIDSNQQRQILFAPSGETLLQLRWNRPDAKINRIVMVKGKRFRNTQIVECSVSQAIPLSGQLLASPQLYPSYANMVERLQRRRR